MLLKEQIEIEDMLSGKESFKNFLILVNNFELIFFKKGYLNTSNYLFFYYTNSIDNNTELLNELKLSESLKSSYLTLKKIKDKILSFYFGIKNDILEYGFYDVSKKIVYKTGKFKIDSTYFKNLPRHKCFSNIRNSIRKINLIKMKNLHKIKEDVKSMWEDKESVLKVVEDYKVRKSFSKDLFDNLDPQILINSAKKYISKFSWNKYVDVDVIIGENMVNFYFILI